MTKNVCDYCKNYICDVRYRIENFERYNFNKQDKKYYKNELVKELADYAVKLDENSSTKVVSCNREEKRI